MPSCDGHQFDSCIPTNRGGFRVDRNPRNSGGLVRRSVVCEPNSDQDLSDALSIDELAADGHPLAWGRRDGARRPATRPVAAVDGRAPSFVMLLPDGREGSTPQEVSNRCGRALTNVRSTSTPAVPLAQIAVISQGHLQWRRKPALVLLTTVWTSGARAGSR